MQWLDDHWLGEGCSKCLIGLLKQVKQGTMKLVMDLNWITGGYCIQDGLFKWWLHKMLRTVAGLEQEEGNYWLRQIFSQRKVCENMRTSADAHFIHDFGSRFSFFLSAVKAEFEPGSSSRCGQNRAEAAWGLQLFLGWQTAERRHFGCHIQISFRFCLSMSLSLRISADDQWIKTSCI